MTSTPSMNAQATKSCAYFAQNDQVENASGPMSGISRRLPKTKLRPVMARTMKAVAVVQWASRSMALKRRIRMPDSPAKVRMRPLMK